MTSKILGVYPVNPDLTKEREKGSFPLNQLTFFLEGDEEKTRRRKELEKFFYEDEEFNVIQDPVDYMTYDEIYEEALIKASKIYFKALNMEDPREMLAVADAFHHEATPLLLHFIMFLPALMGHATEEQLDRWLPDAIELKVIGTYAQTELGHGTFIRGLETRATYDPTTSSFILESPSLKSIKWWPGGLGKTANWAIVMASLYTEGQNRGVHPFMVQLRHQETHEPLPGIVVGEIGPKMGLKAADNGFLQLNKVRIPRDNMLMKNARVEEDGTFIQLKSDKLTYGTMVFVRVVVIDMVAFNVARAATIAVRYSCVRRQSEIEKGCGEVQIIDYQAQQMKLLPSIALAHAFKSAFVFLMGVYRTVADDIELKGELDQLGQLHAMSSGLKALSTEMGSHAIETCRRATGGHGYLLMSGLPRLYASTVAACTYEGENTVLYLQTARYLLKTLDMSVGEKSSLAATAYLSEKDHSPALMNKLSAELDQLLKTENTLDDDEEEVTRNRRVCEILIQIMKSSARTSVLTVRHRLDQLTSGDACHSSLNQSPTSTATTNSSSINCNDSYNNIMLTMSPERAWIACQLDLIHAAKLHLIQFLLTNYVEWVSSAPTSIQVVLTRLSLLLFYTIITERFGDYIESGLTTDHIKLIRLEVPCLLTRLRPDALSLVDAFDFHDIVLMSTLGCYDGAVYERMFDMAKKAPLNKVDPHPAFISHIKSLTKSKL